MPWMPTTTRLSTHQHHWPSSRTPATHRLPTARGSAAASSGLISRCKMSKEDFRSKKGHKSCEGIFAQYSSSSQPKVTNISNVRIYLQQEKRYADSDSISFLQFQLDKCIFLIKRPTDKVGSGGQKRGKKIGRVQLKASLLCSKPNSFPSFTFRIKKRSHCAQVIHLKESYD
jgi:hypothetical protein